jgi:hypothetical protein
MTGSIYLFMDHLIMLSIGYTIGCETVEWPENNEMGKSLKEAVVT